MNKFKLKDKVMNEGKETVIVQVFTVKDRSYYKTEESVKENPYLYIHEDNLYLVREIGDLSEKELLELIESYNMYKNICNITGTEPGSLRDYLNNNINEIDYLIGFEHEDIKRYNNIILYDDMILKDSDSEAQISYKILMCYKRYVKESNVRRAREAYNRAMENLARI